MKMIGAMEPYGWNKAHRVLEDPLYIPSNKYFLFNTQANCTANCLAELASARFARVRLAWP